MPNYRYKCPSNDTVVDVSHRMAIELRTWGELCYCAQIPLGETDPSAPVEKVMTPPAISIPTGNSDLKGAGFTKLVKRDAGVYENVTATENEARYMRADDPSSVPDIRRKVSD